MDLFVDKLQVSRNVVNGVIVEERLHAGFRIQRGGFAFISIKLLTSVDI